ncbi:MAG: serine/threonine protein kinase [Gemmatimonadales bacterium]|nr:serine/threonine protein kinase [Gemmatimonadales bacterium]
MSTVLEGSNPELLARLQSTLGQYYRVHEAVGAGGMAVVFRATRLADDRPVAIKTVHPAIARALGHERFRHEVETLKALNHPGIAPLLDFGENGDLLYLVMPFYSGPTLRARIAAEGQLSLDEATSIASTLLEALDYAHRHNTIHRDVKPENVLFDGSRPVLADFGIARAIIRSGGEGLSSTGIVLGTPAYMSPEQAGADRQLDGRADLYSVGCVLFEMIAGVPPFVGPNQQVIQSRHLREPAPDLRNSRTNVPASVAEAVARSLAKVPADRFRTAAEFAQAIAPGRWGQVGRRRRWLVPAALAVVALAGAWAYQSRKPAAVPDRYLVLPFRGDEAARAAVPSPDQIGRLLWRELSRWRGLDLVDEALVEDRVVRLGPGLGRDGTRRLAAAVRAGRVIRGEVVTVGDSLEVHAALYLADGSPDPIRRARVAIPTAPGGSVSRLTEPMASLARSLIADEARFPGGSGLLESTTSYPALVATLAGDSALLQWDLEAARVAYRSAMDADPAFALPKLRFATASLWAAAAPEEWAGAAAGAAASVAQLAPMDRLEAQALDALARGSYPDACRLFDQVIAADSLRFNGWFGRGECLARDDRVIRDQASPSGWRFRSSFAAAIGSLRTALGLVPLSHRAIGGAAVNRLAWKLMASANHLRFGRDSTDRMPRFAAFPGFDGDSLGFVPYPIDEVLAGKRMPSTLADAVRESRRTFLAITSRWIVEYPSSPPAIKAHAWALEVNGLVTGAAPESALELIRSLRAGLPADSVDLALGAWEVRLRLKARRYTAAAQLASQLLASAARAPSQGDVLPGLAALIGHAERAASWSESFGQSTFVSMDGQVIDSPEGLLRTARRLLAFAALGGPRDSLRAVDARLRREVAAQVEPARQDQVYETLRLQAAHLAFPDLPLTSDTLLPISRIQRALTRGDRAAARAEIARLDASRRVQAAADVSPEYLVLEARLLAALGDSGAARSRLDGLFNDPRSLSQDVLDWVASAGAIGRGLALRTALGGDISLNGADTAWAALWRRRVR